MSISINVVCRKEKRNKNNTAPIHFRFTLNRKIRYVSTGLSIDIDKWDFDNQRVKEDVSYDNSIQYQLDTKLIEYKKKMRKLEILDIQVTLENIIETNNRKVNCTLSNCFTREINRF